MAVVARGDAVISACFHNLFKFQPPIISPSLGKTGLKESATPTATEVVGSVRLHIDKVFFSYHCFDNKPKIFGNGVSQGLPHDLTGILHGKLDFQILVPIRVDL